MAARAARPRISGRECSMRDETPCAFKVAIGVATRDAVRSGAPNAEALRRMADTLGRGGSVPESVARRELTAWARSALTSDATSAAARTRAVVVAQALNLRVPRGAHPHERSK